jgi:hypothetical protein
MTVNAVECRSTQTGLTVFHVRQVIVIRLKRGIASRVTAMAPAVPIPESVSLCRVLLKASEPSGARLVRALFSPLDFNLSAVTERTDHVQSSRLPRRINVRTDL